MFIRKLEDKLFKILSIENPTNYYVTFYEQFANDDDEYQ